MNWKVYSRFTAERDFSKFDQLLKAGKSRNCKFKRKAIRSSINLINSDNFQVEKIVKKVTLMLADREIISILGKIYGTK